MAIDQDGRQIRILDPLGQQQRTAGRRIDQHLADEAHVLERRPQVVGQIGRKIGGAVARLALARHPDQARELGQEGAAVVVAGSAVEGGLTAHRWARQLVAGKGCGYGMKAVNRYPSLAG